jgi:hypothetical protein
MSGILRRRPSASMVVAFVALLVAMGGTGYAAISLPKNSVGSKQLKSSAVTSSKVKNGSLLKSDFRAGQLPAGPRGLQGPAGLQGPVGPQGPAGATNVIVREGAETVGTSIASCQGGERAVGGGGVATDADGLLWASNPSPAVGTPTGWEADAIDRVTGLADAALAYVICASP